MILILTEPSDPHAKVVSRKLEQRGATFFLFDNAQFPAQTQISLTYSTTNPMQGAVRVHGKTFDLGHITAAWWRRPRVPVPHDEITNSPTRRMVEEVSKHFIYDMWHMLDCLWVPATHSTVQRAQCKASQLQLAAALGFEIPPTLITNSPKEFLEFYRRHNGNIVSKSIHPSLSSALQEPISCYTQVISKRDVGYAQAVRYCPAIFQAYVPKHMELRITVVGHQVFAAEIHSQQTNRTRHDWRHYDYGQTPHRPHKLPDEVRRLCLRLVELLGLCFGAIDMVLTPDGRYVFLEINPNGQYAWIEDLTGLPISDAIRDLLTSRETATAFQPGAEAA